MKDFKKETAVLLIESSKNLVQFIASAAFEFWQRKDFRLFIDFNNLSKTEQDRIFNELEVSVLGLFILHLDNAIRIANNKKQAVVLTALRNDLPKAFLQIYIDLGIEKKFIDQWKILIDMRLKEYRNGFKTACEVSKSWKEFKGDKKLKISWAIIETISIDCLTHIRRGNVQKNDSLWKLLRKWFITLDGKLFPITNEMM